MRSRGLMRKTWAHRRLGGSAALLGMALYAVLVPWHIVSQATLALEGGIAAIDAMPPCHDASAGGPSKSPVHKTHCPICTGLASLHLGLACAGVGAVAAADSSATVFPLRHVPLTAPVVQAPPSRAPPLLLA
jgi:hypothetical protein